MTLERDIGWPVSLSENHYQLSYRIRHDDSNIANPAKLKSILEEVNFQVRDHVWTGWSMFYPFSGPEIEPKITTENEDGSGALLLETDLRNAYSAQHGLPDYWRVGLTGFAVLIRPYREDRFALLNQNEDPPRRAGEWLSPETPIRETAELVRHAYLFSKHFPTAHHVEFMCVWNGLENRHLAGFDEYWSPSYVAHSRSCRTDGNWQISELISQWPEVVSDLACKVVDMFGYEHCGPGFVKRMETKFRKLPSNVG